MPLKYFIGCDKEKAASSSHEKGADNMKYEAIFVVANKDRLDDILDAAEAAGSTGGTVIHGRGAGSQEKAALFNIEIEPEKVIVLILSQVSKTTGIVDAIRDKLDVHKPNTGIVFVMDEADIRLYRISFQHYQTFSTHPLVLQPVAGLLS